MGDISALHSKVAQFSFFFAVIVLMSLVDINGACDNTCHQCAERYGCMTPGWGKCCTQFFMSNGRKRSSDAPTSGSDSTGDEMERVMEYVRVQSRNGLIEEEKLLAGALPDALPDALNHASRSIDTFDPLDKRTSLSDSMTEREMYMGRASSVQKRKASPLWKLLEGRSYY